MNYIVLDLEWNQAYNCKVCSELQFEIIEIGAIKLDENFNIIDEFEELICPKLYKKIHPIIEDITKLQYKKLQDKECFPQVIDKFLRWCGKDYGNDYMMCSYGSQDLCELQKNMKYFKCDIPWRYPFLYYDIQKIYSVQFEDGKEQRALEYAINNLNIECSSAFHRAYNDAIYTAEVVKHLDKNIMEDNMSVDYYNIPKSLEQEKEIIIGQHREFVSKQYEDKEDLLSRPELYVTRCLICNKKCRKKIKWFSDNSKYSCIAICEEHGYIEGQMHIKKTQSDRYYAIRRVSMSNEDGLNSVYQKKENIREKRRQKRNKNKE